MTNDNKRGGSAPLFAGLNTPDGIAIGGTMQRHRHEEFIRFLNAIEAEPRLAWSLKSSSTTTTHRHTKVQAWLARHEYFVFHFTPTSCSWSNAVEGFVANASGRA